MTIRTLSDLDGKLMDGLKFCKIVYALFESARRTPEGNKALQPFSNHTEKRLIEELLPICRYIQTSYRTGRYISVCWKDDNQSFDAELHQEGDYVSLGYYAAKSYLEVTCARHQNEPFIWELSKQGKSSGAPEDIRKERGKPIVSEPVVFSGHEHVEGFAQIVVSAIEKKDKKNYPDGTSLVVQCYLNSLYPPDDWQILVEKVRRSISAVSFQEILLVDGLSQRTVCL